ncbi:MAG TPA: HD domain-containing phosphohydrolase [Thermoanaerobaculia bacterium]|nr:HD domain-containing phosphohydrolase [Thermoanaerobaculia bacterium]
MSDPVKPAMNIDAMALQVAGAAAGEKGPNAVMYAFFQLFKTAQIHAIDNKAIVQPVKTMADLSSAMVAGEGQISFQVKDRSIFVNGTKLKLSADEYELARGIFEFFEERGIGGFTIEAALTTESTRSLLKALVYLPPTERKFENIDAAIKASGIPFRINRPLGGGKKSDSEIVLERRALSFQTYAKLVVLYQSLIAGDRVNAAKRQFVMKKIGRTVQTLVDLCLEDEHTFAGAASVRNADAYAAHHAANVAVLSMVIGKKIGLPKSSLADLGLAAIFFDIGLRHHPDIVDKPEPLTPDERATIGQHPIRSVEFLLEERKLSKAALSRIVVAFEHHRHFGGGGYPPGGGRRPHLFTRIVSIADVYDALTTQRPWRNAWLPDEAIALMMRESGKYFDPALLKVFVSAIGLYPVGTLVRFDDGKVAVVVHSGGDGARVTRPAVTLIGSDGKPGETIDLARNKNRRIVSAEDAAKYGFQTSSVVAASAGIVN